MSNSKKTVKGSENKRNFFVRQLVLANNHEIFKASQHICLFEENKHVFIPRSMVINDSVSPLGLVVVF